MVAPKVSLIVATTEDTVTVTFDQAMNQDANFFTAGNYTVTGHTVPSVSAPTTSTALLQLGEEMLDGSSLTGAVDSSLENVGSEAMDGGFLDDTFTGLGVAPEVSVVTAPVDGRIRVTFDEPLQDNAALVDADNYVLTPVDSGAGPLAIASLSPESATYPTYVDLYVNEMTDGAAYNCAVGDAGGAILDIAGNALDSGAPNNTRNFTGNGTLPSVNASATVLAGNIIRINFDEAMRKDAQLSQPANYLFTPVTGGAAQLYFDSVLVPDVDSPTYVDIEVSEMTDGATYDVTVNGPTDNAFNPIGASDTATFTGVGENPSIESLVSVSKNRVDVVFSEPMLNNVDINTASKYAWDNGLVTLEVLEVTAAGVVKLATNDQVPGLLYTLIITP